MPSIKECPKEIIMTQSSGYVQLPLIANAALEDARTFPVPISQELIENLPEDIKREICSSPDLGMSSYSEFEGPLLGGMRSYYIRMEKYGECLDAISAAGKAFVDSLNNNRPLLEVDNKYFGLASDAVSKAPPPAVISADERDKFSLIRVPWGEKLAKQMVLALGSDMVRREENSFNYYLRHNDQAKLKHALDQVLKVSGRMEEGREQKEIFQYFMTATYWEFSQMHKDVYEVSSQNTSVLVEVESEFLGLDDSKVVKAELPPIISPDEKENFALLRVPWGEKLARQMTLVLGRDVLRSEKGSSNYFIRKDDKAGLKLAMERLSKAAGSMTVRGEMSDKVKAFEDAVYWELNNVVNGIEKEEDRERASMGEIERLLEIKDPLQFAANFSLYFLGLAILTWAFGFFGHFGHKNAEWAERLFGNRPRKIKEDGKDPPLADGDSDKGKAKEAKAASPSKTFEFSWDAARKAIREREGFSYYWDLTEAANTLERAASSSAVKALAFGAAALYTTRMALSTMAQGALAKEVFISTLAASAASTAEGEYLKYRDR